MARFAEPDIYLTGTVIGGLPTCVFRPKPYNRKITNIIVTNTVPSAVACYRAQLGTVPVAQNALGANNTMRGIINLPAGQTFYVQWSVLGASASGATARVSFERDDNPLEGSEVGQIWDVELVDSITIPNTAGPNDPAIVIGQQIPNVLRDLVSDRMGIDHSVIGAIIFRQNIDDQMYIALVTSPNSFGVIRGYLFDNNIALSSIDASEMQDGGVAGQVLNLGRDVNDLITQIGSLETNGALLRLLQSPFVVSSEFDASAKLIIINALTTAGVIRHRVNGTNRLQVTNTGVIITGTASISGATTAAAITASGLIDGTAGVRAASDLNIAGTVTAAGDSFAPTDWAFPTLLGAWVNFGGTFVPARYRKLVSGQVEVQGTVKSGAVGSTIFNLPAGFRPTDDIGIVADGSLAHARISVLSNGNVVFDAGNNAGVSMLFSFYPL